MNYILSVEAIGTTGKFLYVVKDETGNVISKRQSFRKYVACTIDGQFYFGRLDLIGKGDHGKQVRYCEENGKEPKQLAFITTERVKAWNLESDFETFAEKRFNENHPEANP